MWQNNQRMNKQKNNTMDSIVVPAVMLALPIQFL
jgi:hypothetical protein